jgi:hypothetical protein
MEGIVEVVHRSASHTLRDRSRVWDNNHTILDWGKKDYWIFHALPDSRFTFLAHSHHLIWH